MCDDANNEGMRERKRKEKNVRLKKGSQSEMSKYKIWDRQTDRQTDGQKDRQIDERKQERKIERKKERKKERKSGRQFTVCKAEKLRQFFKLSI